MHSFSKSKLDHMHLMQLFVCIAQSGSFSKAAAQLDISATKASKDIRHLERSLNVTLLSRTTRSVYLTDSGKQFYHSAQGILELHQQMLDRIKSSQVSLIGELRISAPSLWGSSILTPIILEFKRKYPQVTFLATYSNERCDLIKDNIHIAFRSTNITNEPYLAKLITADTYTLCAAPSYLKDKEAINTPSDLNAHNFITLAHSKNGFENINFDDSSQNSREQLRNELSFSNKEDIFLAVKQGFGIAVLPYYLVQESLGNNEIVQVLKEHPSKSSKFYAFYTQRRKESALINTFIDFVIESVA